MGNRLVKGGRSLLMFDELEDIFSGDGGLTGRHGAWPLSKQWFNDLLDTNPVPTVWISNRVDHVDPAFLRRFTFALEFRPLGALQRARVLTRHLEGALAPAEVIALAESYAVSPGELGTAVAASRLVSRSGVPEGPTIEQLLAPVEKLVSGAQSRRGPHFEADTFSIEALNSREDMVALAASLAGWKPSQRPGVSLCLYGPPGAGKSEYVKYLAHRMGRRIVYRRVSDLQSKWVRALVQRS